MGGGEWSVRILGEVELLHVRGRPDQRISQLGTAQKGRVARHQLLEVGITDRMIETRVARGVLTREHNGVYIVGPTLDVPFGRETAALLAVERSVLSHLSAAAAHELIRLADGEEIHVTVRSPRKSRRGIIVHRTNALTRDDRVICHGLPATGVARTLLDISEILPTREVERALDEALARKLVTLGELRAVIDRTRNRSGATILRRLIAWRTTSVGSRTKWQRMAYKAFVLAGLPEPEQDVWWLGYQHDFLWRGQGVTLEIDGYPWHSTKSNMERDRAKDVRVKQAGGDPNRVSNSQVENKILEVVALIAARLAIRDPSRRGNGSASG